MPPGLGFAAMMTFGSMPSVLTLTILLETGAAPPELYVEAGTGGRVLGSSDVKTVGDVTSSLLRPYWSISEK